MELREWTLEPPSSSTVKGAVYYDLLNFYSGGARVQFNYAVAEEFEEMWIVTTHSKFNIILWKNHQLKPKKTVK